VKVGDLIRFGQSSPDSPFEDDRTIYLVLERGVIRAGPLDQNDRDPEPMWKLLNGSIGRILYIYEASQENCEVVSENRESDS